MEFNYMFHTMQTVNEQENGISNNAKMCQAQSLMVFDAIPIATSLS